MAAEHGITVAGISLATMGTATLFGVSGTTIAIGTFFSVVGLLGRCAFEFQKVAEGSSGMTPARVLSWLGAGLIGSPFITIIYLVLLKTISVQSDGIAILGLLLINFSGPKMLTALLNVGITTVNKRLGINLPTIGSPSPPAGGAK